MCLVFEKVNTGGKALDAFELVTAMYAGERFHLRDDWKARRDIAPREAVASRSMLSQLPRRLARAVSRLQNAALRGRIDLRNLASGEWRLSRDDNAKHQVGPLLSL